MVDAILYLGMEIAMLARSSPMKSDGEYFLGYGFFIGGALTTYNHTIKRSPIDGAPRQNHANIHLGMEKHCMI